MPNAQSSDGVSVLIKHKWEITLAAVFVLIAAALLYIILPLLDGIILGIVLAYIARPMKQYLDRYVPRVSSYIATSAIVLPIFLITGLAAIEVSNLIIWAIENKEYVVGQLVDLVGRLNLPGFVYDKVRDIILNFTSYLLPLIQQLPVGAIASTLAGLALAVLNIFIAITLCFYLLVDGGRLVEKITSIVPVEIEDFFRRFLSHLDGILYAIFIGNTYSAIAVGLLSLVVFFAFGFGYAITLSALMLIAAIVPMFSGWMVIVPLAIYRYFEMGSESAITFLIVSTLVIIIPPDLLIRPYFINVRSNIHPMLIIIAFIGGGLVGGIAGFFVAPMLLGAIVAAYRATEDIRALKVQ